MTVKLEVAPERLEHLQQSAQALGVSVEEFLERMLFWDEERIAQWKQNQAAIALLRQWRAEDQANWEAMNDEEKQQAQAEAEAFQCSLLENRYGRSIAEIKAIRATRKAC